MAYTFTIGLSEISLCESIDDTNGIWTGVGDAPAAETEDVIQGSGSIAYSFRNEVGYAVYTLDTAVDMSNIDTHLYWWINTYVGPQLATQANGGLRLRIEDTSGRYRTFWYGGSDTYDGAWTPYVQWLHATDYNAGDSNDPTNLAFTAIKVISLGFYNTQLTKNVDNCFVDAVRYGTGGIQITGQPDTTSFQYKALHEIAAEDAKNANKWGITFDLDGVIGVQGKILVGSDAQTATTLFESRSEIAVFLDRRVRGGWAGIWFYGAPSFKTTIRIGQQIGTGADSVGVKGTVFTNESGTAIPRWWIDDVDIAELLLAACVIQNWEYVKIGDTGTHIQPTSAIIIDNIFFNNTGLQKRLTPTTTGIYLRNRIVQMTGTYSIGIFDAVGISGEGWIIVDSNGMYTNQNLTVRDYEHPQANEDVDFTFPADITLDFINPNWSLGYPQLTWTYGTSLLNEYWEYLIVVQKADATKIQNARCRIFDDYDDTFELSLSTDASGEASGNVLYKYWHDGSAGNSPDVTYGPWVERIVAFDYNFFEATADFAGAKVDKTQVLSLDPLIDQVESYYDALSGISVVEHGATGLKLIGYDAGTIAFSPGDVVTGAVSGGSGTVREVIGDTTSGELVLHTWNGTAFNDNEALQVSAVTRAQSNTVGGTGGYDLEYWWEILGNSNSLKDVYGWLHTQTAKASPSTWVTEMLKHRLYLLLPGYSTERVANEGVFISGRGAGDISAGMTDDGGTAYTPPQQTALTIQAQVSLVGAEVRIYDLDVTPPDFGTELAGVESNGSATYVFLGTPGNLIKIQVLHSGYEEFVQDYTLPSADTLLNITLVPDLNS